MLFCLLLLWLQDPSALEHIKKGLQLSQQGDLQSANVHLQKTLQLEPGEVEARYYLAVNQYRLEQFAPAKANLEPHSPGEARAKRRCREELRLVKQLSEKD